MAISPNTDFTAGQVFTAAQANAFPRGIMAYAQVTSSDLSITAEEVQITSASFTAVANRYYKVTYLEPGFAGGTGYVAARVRKTNISGAIIQQTYFGITADTDKNRTLTCQWVGTFTAGAQVLVATLQTNTGTGAAYRGADSIAFLLVEDLGPA
jgi:acyl dehydratase